MWKKNKFRILGGILIMSIGLNITGCSDGKGGNDNENVNKNKSYSEVALEVLEERYGEPFELRQIGVRDEAKMLGGLGPCGRPMCCSSFLGDFTSVSIKMAKEQNLSLNPTKISGICGRLMCCLNYEQSTYEDIRKRMPQVGSIVKTEEGTGEVISNNTVKETVRVKYKRAGEEIINDFNIDNIELIEGNYEDSIDDSDIRLEIDSEEDKKFIKALIKDN